MSSYVLIITVIHASIGAVDTQREAGFSSYQDCESEAVARIESQPLNSDSRIRWSCQRERATIRPDKPRATAICHRCGGMYNHDTLKWQFEYAGYQRDVILPGAFSNGVTEDGVRRKPNTSHRALAHSCKGG